MDLRKLKKLIDLVEESGIAELEVTEGEGKVRIVKAPPQVIAAPMQMAMPAAMRIWAATDSKAVCPISVCDGRNWLLEYAKTHFSGLPIHAQAQAYLQAFYASFGFHPVSEIYLEDDIPHIDMIIATHRN